MGVRPRGWSARGARAVCVRELDRLVGLLASLVTRPALPVELVLRLVRRWEVTDPRRVTAALLGP